MAVFRNAPGASVRGEDLVGAAIEPRAGLEDLSRSPLIHPQSRHMSDAPLAHEAQIPNPRLIGLSPFLGTWKTVGHHSMIEGVTLHGRTSIEWHEGGGFACIRTEIDEPKIPSAIAIIGSDDENGALTMQYFDERAVSRRFDVSVDGNQLRWERMAPGFSQRYVITLGDEGKTARGISTLCRDGKTWEQDMELTYTREA